MWSINSLQGYSHPLSLLLTPHNHTMMLQGALQTVTGSQAVVGPAVTPSRLRPRPGDRASDHRPPRGKTRGCGRRPREREADENSQQPPSPPWLGSQGHGWTLVAQVRSRETGERLMTCGCRLPRRTGGGGFCGTNVWTIEMLSGVQFSYDLNCLSQSTNDQMITVYNISCIMYLYHYHGIMVQEFPSGSIKLYLYLILSYVDISNINYICEAYCPARFRLSFFMSKFMITIWICHPNINHDSKWYLFNIS